MLRFIPNCYKNQKMFNKTVDTSPSATQFVSEWYRTNKRGDKTVDICRFVFDSFVFDSVPDPYKTQEICDKVVSNEPSMLKYCLDSYKIQEMCNKAVDACLSALKTSSWLVCFK